MGRVNPRSTQQPVAVASTQLQALPDRAEEATSSCPLPPKDETFDSPMSALRELLAAPDIPEGADRYDRIGLETGGIWRSKRYGFVPVTVSQQQHDAQQPYTQYMQ